jgi:hypothetical protein
MSKKYELLGFVYNNVTDSYLEPSGAMVAFLILCHQKFLKQSALI